DKAAFALNKVTGLDNDGNKVADTVFDRLFNILEAPTAGKSAVAETTALSDFQAVFSPRLRNRILAMSSSEKISNEELPKMIRDTFISKDGKSNLVTISPRENPWHGQFRKVFNAQVSTVTDQSTGMILAADQLGNIAEHDSVRALIAALIAVFLILLADFRNLRLTLLTFLPLLLSFTSLYGLMALFGIKFDFVNIIAVPLLVGIGIDDSVHINHRYLMEGRGRMNLAISETGSAVALTTITTMIGFSSFIPSIMRAMRSTGIVLTLAMALAFIYSVFLHPALLILVSEKLGWNLNPRFFKKDLSHHED
ncbi:MAG: MMPL family transporter, partial [Spirochaetaceae bacterium]|nr:MMPL family transporter [Spirochaetaceae bacterium]